MSAIDALLEPISLSLPAGEDLCFSPEFDAIAEARRFDDPSLDQGEWVTALKEADWPFVVDRCALLLQTRTKDLRLAVWFAEASGKMRGFQGITQGLFLVAGLCERYWAVLHPVPDDGDQERRIGNLAWLLTRAAQLAREVPLTEGRDAAYSLADFEAARLRAAAGSEAAMQGVPLSAMEAARRKTSHNFLQALAADAAACREALAGLERVMDACLGIHGPGFSATREVLDRIVDMVTRHADDAGSMRSMRSNYSDRAGHSASVALPPVETGPAVEPVALLSPISSSGLLQHRSQALAQLRAVAEFFRRTEPHSPVAYLADKAAQWGEMPLHEWLQTVIKDGASLAHVEELLGMTPGTRPDS